MQLLRIYNTPAPLNRMASTIPTVSSEHFGVRVRLLALEEVICLALLWPKILSARVCVLWEVGPHRLLNFLQTPLGQVSMCMLICSGF